MGISPAVYISNFYLFTYEYDFYMRVRTVQQTGHRSELAVPAITQLLLRGQSPPGGGADVAASVLDSFLYTARYIDDLYSLANPLFHHLTYVSQSWHGVTGIYPTALNLATAGSGAQVQYMDLTITMVARSEQNGLVADFKTTLYDKVVAGPFKRLPVIKYPHITSALSWRVKYNVLTTEFHRLIRRVSDAADMANHIARITFALFMKGYQVHRLCFKLRGLYHRHAPGRWRAVHPSHYMRMVVWHLSNMFLDHHMPGVYYVLQQLNLV